MTSHTWSVTKDILKSIGIVCLIFIFGSIATGILGLLFTVAFKVVIIVGAIWLFYRLIRALINHYHTPS